MDLAIGSSSHRVNEELAVVSCPWSVVSYKGYAEIEVRKPLTTDDCPLFNDR